MKNNSVQNKFRWLYIAGFFVILATPILTLPPWFYPPDWGKTIVFRSVAAILLFLFIYQFFYKKNQLEAKNFKKNPIFWALGGLLGVYLLASIFSVDPYFSFWGSPYRGGGFVTFAFYFIFAFLAFALFKKDDWRRAWDFLIFIGIMVCLIGSIQFFGLFSKIFVATGAGVGSTIGNPIFLGIYLLLLFFPTLSFAIEEKNKYKKIFYIFALLFFLSVILVAGSRAAYLGIVTGTLFFLLFYPRKLKILKISVGLLLLSAICVLFYVNFISNVANIEPARLSNFQMLESKLLVKKVFADERYRAWQTAVKVVLDKPILGWGPENLSVGFDKNYDPNVTWSPWWDKAHNIFLDTGAQTGILGILAYILLFIALFWQLQKAKKNTEQSETPSGLSLDIKMTVVGIEAALLGYIVANFFSFDSIPTYLIFFFIIAYSLYLTNYNFSEINYSENKIKGRGLIISFLFLSLVIFLWQYNLMPFQINVHINNADILVNQKKCDNAIGLLEKYINKHSFLDSYIRMDYVMAMKTCSGINPDKNLEYAKKGILALKEALKIQPLYTRYWIYLGSFTTVIAYNEQNPQIKQSLINEASSYLDKAESLSPRHTEIIIEEARLDMLVGDYQKMKQDAERCVATNQNSGDCYWTKALAEIYLKDFTASDKDFQLAEQKQFSGESVWPLFQMAQAYSASQNYIKLAETYEKLITISQDPQYHASLAFTYSQIGEYKKAREQAMVFLQMMPGAKAEVDAFLKTLPY